MTVRSDTRTIRSMPGIEQDQAGPALAGEAAEPEHDRALVLAQHAHGRAGEHREQQRRRSRGRTAARSSEDLPVLGAADGEREAVDALDHDRVAPLEHGVLVEAPRARPPQRAVEEDLARGPRPRRRGRRAPRRRCARARGGRPAPCARRPTGRRRRCRRRRRPVASASAGRGPRRRSRARSRWPAAATAAVPSAPCEGTWASATASAAPTSRRTRPNSDMALVHDRTPPRPRAHPSG